MRKARSRLVPYLAAGLSILATVAVYFGEVMPLRERDERLERYLAKNREMLSVEREKIDQAREREQQTAQARADLSRLLGYLPERSASVRLPLLTKEHFQKIGFQPSVMRLNGIRQENEMLQCRVAYMGVGVPLGRTPKDMSGYLIAVAEFEEQHPFVKVLDFSVGVDALEPQRLMGGFNFTALVRE